MEDTVSVKGQLLIRSIIEEYRNLLEVLADPQILLKDANNSQNFGIANRQDAKRLTQEILHKLTRLFSQLKSVYNQCLDEMKRYGGSEECLPSATLGSDDDPMNQTAELNKDSSESGETRKLMQDVKEKNSQLKNIINEMRQLIWDIDIMKRS